MYPVTITLLFLGFAIVMFAWEKIPLALTAIIVNVGLILTGVLDVQTGFSGFTNGTVILFVGMFIVGGALFETGMADDIGKLVTKFAKTERQAIISIMVIAGFMGAFLSNTGITAVLIPVVLGVTAKSGFTRSRLMMPLALASTMGGDLSVIGTPGNMIAQNALSEVGMSFGFFEFAIVGLPILILGILYYVFFAYKMLPEIDKELDADSAANNIRDYSNVPAWKKKASLIILIITILGMIFENIVGIPLHMISSIGAIALVLLGVISEKQAYNAIDMKVIFLFAGTLSLATALDHTGTGEIIARMIIGVLGENPSQFLLLSTILFLTCTFTMIMSNTATAALLVPINLSIALSIGADPRGILMATAIGSSWAFASPISTPANAMVLSLGGYKFKDYLKIGLPLVGIAFITTLIIIPIFFPLFP